MRDYYFTGKQVKFHNDSGLCSYFLLSFSEHLTFNFAVLLVQYTISFTDPINNPHICVMPICLVTPSTTCYPIIGIYSIRLNLPTVHSDNYQALCCS